ncbi:hypothetical protein HKD24_09190 [Gluconobacter sp. LMG 31484]|uniref:Uncharacterized protein n=1 Tax=Gluconobacter vitians TaxID=2728102 RepID=A0ABR9Y689_9PROT|nr:hypothetical protein [Gluconobacter vitians]MBF0859387.1 hypothetical protein [Gluconobacter vitians]
MSKDFSDINPGILAAAATLAVRKYESALECFVIEEARKSFGGITREEFINAGMHEDWLKQDILDVMFVNEVERLNGQSK